MSEQPGQREKVAKMKSQMIKGGADSRYAQQKAVEIANKQDRRNSAKQ